MHYSNGLKARMVRRMAGPERMSASALAKEVGISQGTLSRWLRDARTVPAMGGNQSKREGGAKSPRHWSAATKLQIVLKAASLSDEALGAFLRSEGLHEAQLTEWRSVATEAATHALAGAPRRSASSAETKKIKQLERELHRKDRALAELAALLALKKRAAEIWGDGDDDTSTRSGT